MVLCYVSDVVHGFTRPSVVLALSLVASCLPRPKPAQPAVAQAPARQPLSNGMQPVPPGYAPQPYAPPPYAPYPPQQPPQQQSPQPSPYPPQQPPPQQPAPQQPPLQPPPPQQLPPQPSPYPPQQQPPYPQPYPPQPYQPQPYPPPPYPQPQPYPQIVPSVPVPKPPLWTHVRAILPIGVTGTTEPQPDPHFTLGIGTEVTFRQTDFLSIGFHVNVGLRNWKSVYRYYSHMCTLGEADDPDDELACLGKKTFGWGIVFGSIEAGWTARFERTRAERSPWLAIGTGLFAMTDAGGFGTDHDSYTVVGHLAQLGAGYDFADVGLGIRTALANNTTVFVTNGAPAYSMLFTIEIRGWGDWHADERGAKPNE